MDRLDGIVKDDPKKDSFWWGFWPSLIGIVGTPIFTGGIWDLKSSAIALGVCLFFIALGFLAYYRNYKRVGYGFLALSMVGALIVLVPFLVFFTNYLHAAAVDKGVNPNHV